MKKIFFYLFLFLDVSIMVEVKENFCKFENEIECEFIIKKILSRKILNFVYMWYNIDIFRFMLYD